jgi:DTW domain-containing protein
MLSPALAMKRTDLLPLRCRRCLLYLARCLCPKVPVVITRTEIVVLRHESERWRNSNTARIAALAMPRTRIFEYPGPAPVLPERTWLLYPDASAPLPTTLPQCLIVLDGSWGQTRRMTQRIPWLRGLPRLALPTPTDPLPRLRAQRRADGMSTLEAILRAVRVLEGDAVAAPLVDLLRAACLHHSMSDVP